MTARPRSLWLICLLASLMACGSPDEPASQPSPSTADSPGNEGTDTTVREGRFFSPVEEALKWLARQQCQDGGWEEGRTSTSEQSDDPYLTGLVIQTFHGSSYTNRGTHPFARTVRDGLRFLREFVGNPVWRSEASDDERALDLATATGALLTAYGLTGSLIWRSAARDGLGRLSVAVRGGGVRDEAVVGWTVLALLEARGVNRRARGAGKQPPFAMSREDFDWLRSRVEVGPSSGQRRRAVAALVRVAFEPLPTAQERLVSLASKLAERPLAWSEEDGTTDPVAALFSAYAIYFAPYRVIRVWQTGSASIADHQARLPKGAEESGTWDPRSLPGYARGRIELTALCARILAMLHLPYSAPRIGDYR